MLLFVAVPAVLGASAVKLTAQQDTSSPDRSIRHRELRWERDGAVFFGTLTVPDGNGPFPTVVLLHAAGQSTRKQWPYRDHANFLAERGIAVLAFDKRGTGESTGIYSRLPDFEQLTGDALGAVDAAKRAPEVDTSRLGLWGRSQGAWVVALAASRSSHIKFAVPVVGGAVRPIEQELFVQANWLRKAGLSDDQISEAEKTSTLVWTYYATAKGRDSAQRALDQLRARPWFETARRSISGYPRSGQLETPEWVLQRRDNELRWQAGLFLDPASFWTRTRIPVLALFAESDQITPTPASVDAMTTLKLKDPSRRFDIEVFSGAAHSMCPANPPELLVDGCAPVSEYLPRLAAWIRAVTCLSKAEPVCKTFRDNDEDALPVIRKD
jgi:dienelactone hydrolase